MALAAQWSQEAGAPCTVVESARLAAAIVHICSGAAGLVAAGLGAAGLGAAGPVAPELETDGLAAAELGEPELGAAGLQVVPGAGDVRPLVAIA